LPVPVRQQRSRSRRRLGKTPGIARRHGILETAAAMIFAIPIKVSLTSRPRCSLTSLSLDKPPWPRPPRAVLFSSRRRFLIRVFLFRFAFGAIARRRATSGGIAVGHGGGRTGGGHGLDPHPLPAFPDSSFSFSFCFRCDRASPRDVGRDSCRPWGWPDRWGAWSGPPPSRGGNSPASAGIESRFR
jgi:hypothetical protein